MARKANQSQKTVLYSRRLSHDDIFQIRVWRAEGDPQPSYREMAECYGVSRSFIGSIISGEVYGDLRGPTVERERMHRPTPKPYQLPSCLRRCRGCGTPVPMSESCTVCRATSYRAGAMLAKILAEAFFLAPGAILWESHYNPYRHGGPPMARELQAAANPIIARFTDTAAIVKLIVGLFGKLGDLKDITEPVDSGVGLYKRKEVILEAIKLATAITKTELDDSAAEMADMLLTPEVCGVIASVIRAIKDRMDEDPDADPVEAVGAAFAAAAIDIRGAKKPTTKKPAKKKATK